MVNRPAPKMKFLVIFSVLLATTLAKIHYENIPGEHLPEDKYDPHHSDHEAILGELRVLILFKVIWLLVF